MVGHVHKGMRRKSQILWRLKSDNAGMGAVQ